MAFSAALVADINSWCTSGQWDGVSEIRVHARKWVKALAILRAAVRNSSHSDEDDAHIISFPVIGSERLSNHRANNYTGFWEDVLEFVNQDKGRT